MYSVLLMTALAGGAAGPATVFGHGGGYYNGCAYYAGGHFNISDFNCGGLYRAGYYACCGGYYACCGGCGCYGGYACCGSYGCCGCYGGYGCHGCYGCGCGGWACCGGCCGCGCCCGGFVIVPTYSYPVAPPVVAPAAPAAPAAPVEPRRPEAAPPPVKQDAARGARARLIVELPADAKLFVDGVEKDGGAERRFFTPDLEPGQEYFYTLRVEGLRDGQPFLEQRRVLVKAGAAVRLTFGPQGDPAVAASK